MSDFQGVAFADGRLPYNLGHAAFEFIESRWGKEGLRQFLFALRKIFLRFARQGCPSLFRFLRPRPRRLDGRCFRFGRFGFFASGLFRAGVGLFSQFGLGGRGLFRALCRLFFLAAHRRQQSGSIGCGEMFLRDRRGGFDNRRGRGVNRVAAGFVRHVFSF